MTEAKGAAWKEVRVFISSTFRDMQAERDHLVRFVFPKLREELLKRRVHLVDVDLRWGVTADQDAFDLCMREIEWCSPRFVGLLGGRYGWVPPPAVVDFEFARSLLDGRSSAGQLTAQQIAAFEQVYELPPAERDYRRCKKPPLTTDAEQWNRSSELVVDLLQRAGLAEAEQSITFAEVAHGALDHLDQPGFRYFYVRDEAVTESIVGPLARDYREAAGSLPARKLVELKRAIRDAKGRVLIAPGREVVEMLPVREYPCTWDPSSSRIVDLDEFGDLVYRDLLDSVVAELGEIEPSPPGGFAEQNALAEAFIEARIERYEVGNRGPALEALQEHAKGTTDSGYLCVVGEPGSGKSALLGKLARDYAREIGEGPSHATDLLISHFIGVNATNVRELLLRLCHELTAGAGLSEDVPADLDGLRQALPRLLEKAAANGRVVLLIDAIDQLDPAYAGPSMAWLPERLPPNVRVILSSLPGPALESLRARRQPPIEVMLPDLDGASASAIVDGYLRRYRKELDDTQRAALLAKAEARNPLYLATALEELRTLGTYEEISTRINSLPGEVGLLFRWILERLEADDGFRDAHGAKVGHTLVRDYCSYLASGRHGMSEAELQELAAPAAAATSQHPGQRGNVAALQRLLRPYLMRRGELIDVYHGQLREAICKRYLAKERQTVAVHRAIAGHFWSVANPHGDEAWQIDGRALAELPYHLARGGQTAELSELLAKLGYLAARVSAGQIYSLVADYSLAEPLSPTLATWRGFLQKHAQRLNRHPEMLIALVNHEGSAEARAQIASLPSTGKWLRTEPEPMPEPEPTDSEALGIEIAASLQFPRPRLASVAVDRGIGFVLESLGAIRVIDLSSMRETETALTVGREPLLTLACAPDASSLVGLDESGGGHLYRCGFGPDGLPSTIEPVLNFECCLPESEAPIVKWHDDGYWFQSGPGAMGRVSLTSGCVSESPFPNGHTGELAALLFLDGVSVMLLRQGHDAVLLSSDGMEVRREKAEPVTAVACGSAEVSVAFSDGELIRYEVRPSLVCAGQTRIGMVRGQLGWDGSRLLWLDATGALTTYQPSDGTNETVQVSSYLLAGTATIPHEWTSRPDGSVLAATSRGLVSFRIGLGQAKPDAGITMLFGGSKWRAIDWQKPRDWRLVEGNPARYVALEHDMTGRLYCGIDGQDRLYAANGLGSDMVLDLDTLDRVPMRDCPPRLSSVAGNAAGGCWYVDRDGNIFFVDQAGLCRREAPAGLSDVSGPGLLDCGEWLVWVGISGAHFRETGGAHATTFQFFRKRIHSGEVTLELVARQTRHPREGQSIGAWFDGAAQELVTLWIGAGRDEQTYRLSVGSIEDAQVWDMSETPVLGLATRGVVEGCLSANGRFLGLTTAEGELSCISVADGKVASTLAASMPFTSVAPGPDGPEFWLVESRARTYRCSLVGGSE
jgi:hypothetical protein